MSFPPDGSGATIPGSPGRLEFSGRGIGSLSPPFPPTSGCGGADGDWFHCCSPASTCASTLSKIAPYSGVGCPAWSYARPDCSSAFISLSAAPYSASVIRFGPESGPCSPAGDLPSPARAASLDTDSAIALLFDIPSVLPLWALPAASGCASALGGSGPRPRSVFGPDSVPAGPGDGSARDATSGPGGPGART